MLVRPGRIVSSCPLVSTVAAGVHMSRPALLPNNGFPGSPRYLEIPRHRSQCNDQRSYENLLVSTHRSRSSDQSHGEKLARRMTCRQCACIAWSTSRPAPSVLASGKTTRTSPGSLYSYNSHDTRPLENDSTPEPLAPPGLQTSDHDHNNV